MKSFTPRNKMSVRQRKSDRPGICFGRNHAEEIGHKNRGVTFDCLDQRKRCTPFQLGPDLLWLMDIFVVILILMESNWSQSRSDKAYNYNRRLGI